MMFAKYSPFKQFILIVHRRHGIFGQVPQSTGRLVMPSSVGGNVRFRPCQIDSLSPQPFLAGQPVYSRMKAVLLDAGCHNRERHGREPNGEERHLSINAVKPIGRLFERRPIAIGKVQIDVPVIVRFLKQEVGQTAFQKFGKFMQIVHPGHVPMHHTNWIYSGSTSTEAASKVGSSTNSLLDFEPRAVTNVPI